jgi:hypothetical protein
MTAESEAVNFLRSRMCYYHVKFKQLGRFSAIWKLKRDLAMTRLRETQQLEAKDAD